MSSTSTSMQDTIERRLKETLSPVHLEVINESHMHSGPATESHFKVLLEVLSVQESIQTVGSIHTLRVFAVFCAVLIAIRWWHSRGHALAVRVLSW